jgi:hypothetical protein
MSATELPNGVVLGFSVTSVAGEGTEGEALALTVVSFEFQVAPGSTATQSFILHRDDGRDLRAALKNPLSLPNPKQTTLPIEEIQ